MLRRMGRTVLILALGFLALAPARLEAAPGTASEVVQSFYAVLLDTMKNAEALGAKGRFDKLEPVVRKAFDLPFMTKMSVGATWNKMTPEQKQRAADAFARYITANYSSQFDDYSGEKFEVLGEQKVPHGVVVRSAIVSADGEKHSMNYVVHDNGPAWQIRDIYLAGSISELATRRADFMGTLRRGGIEELIAQLNKKANDLLG